MSVQASDPNELIDFNSLDEQYFTLDSFSDEVIFAISKNFGFLRKNTGRSPKFLKRLLELADKINFRCMALITHAKLCQDNTLPDELPISVSGEDLILCTTSSFNAAILAHPTMRQKELCFFSKCLLSHATNCKNKCCPVDYCQIFREVLEYQFLFSRI
jgi:hypothetical protein